MLGGIRLDVIGPCFGPVVDYLSFFLHIVRVFLAQDVGILCTVVVTRHAKLHF